ncbi:MAG: endonuclease MutS2 [Clostridiales bacterium]|nr:endonuclease MutS2 [Clostridiales bacterium]
MKPLYEKLEFDIICQRVAALSASEVVSDRIKCTEPTDDLKTASLLLTQTADAVSILASAKINPAFDDIEPIIAKARVGALLSPAELLKIKHSISELRALKNRVESAEGCDSLKDITAWVRACLELENDISRAVDTETELKDSASEKLSTLRRAITRANAKLKERLDSYTRQSEISKYLQDNIVTVRDGRYVVPVRAEYRSAVKGLVHDISSTGATVFIEPFAVVEANNALKTLITEEQIEVERILAELGKKVVENAVGLIDGQRVLTECGIIFARAEYARRTDSYMPKLNDSGKIVLNGARHPLIDENSVVPVDIELTDKRILLISGPNTGGKTVALKTVGLFALMAASGMYLPTSDNSEMCVFEKIHCDMGDAQSIAQSLSTFSAHMKNIGEITAVADNRSLVLLDEPGDGTDPEEGAALAVGIIKYLVRCGATAVITTHFNAVKTFAINCHEVSNACMQFDNKNLVPTYRLITGVSGSSYAIEIAERLGIDQNIIRDARASLSQEKIAFDKILREAEQFRNEALADKEQAEAYVAQAQANAKTAEKLKSEYEYKLSDIIENARSLVRRKADEYIERADALIDELKEELKKGNEEGLFAARKIAARLSDDVPVEIKAPSAATKPSKPSELVPGVQVHISGLEKDGVVVGKAKGDKITVAIGQIKTEIPIASLSVIETKEQRSAKKSVKRVADPVSKEVMMLGMTVMDATESLDRLLADIPPHSTLRIVHGKGTGALGKGIQAYLKKHARIKSFRYGNYGEGDSGVTIVEIK